jgi:hypothetical protein
MHMCWADSCRHSERYRELIDAADTIVKMASSSAEVCRLIALTLILNGTIVPCVSVVFFFQSDNDSFVFSGACHAPIGGERYREPAAQLHTAAQHVEQHGSAGATGWPRQSARHASLLL